MQQNKRSSRRSSSNSTSSHSTSQSTPAFDYFISHFPSKTQRFLQEYMGACFYACASSESEISKNPGHKFRTVAIFYGPGNAGRIFIQLLQKMIEGMIGNFYSEIDIHDLKNNLNIIRSARVVGCADCKTTPFQPDDVEIFKALASGQEVYDPLLEDKFVYNGMFIFSMKELPENMDMLRNALDNTLDAQKENQKIKLVLIESPQVDED